MEHYDTTYLDDDASSSSDAQGVSQNESVADFLWYQDHPTGRGVRIRNSGLYLLYLFALAMGGVALLFLLDWLVLR